MAKSIRLSFRSSEEFRDRLAKAAKTLGLDQSVVALAAIEAVINHVEETGELTIPIKLPKKYEDILPMHSELRVAEESEPGKSSGYSTQKKKRAAS